MKHSFPTCDRYDCAANGKDCREGKCGALNDTNFDQRGGGVEVCPFYKKREDKEDENVY